MHPFTTSIRGPNSSLTLHSVPSRRGAPEVGIVANMARTRSQYPTHHHPPEVTQNANTPADNTQDGAADLRNGIDAGDPLTAKGRTKKRQREKDSFDPNDPDRYRYKAYHIRRAFDLFGHIPTIVNEGIKRRAKEAAGEEASHIQSDRDYETFNLIINHLDGLNDDIVRLKRNPKEFRALIRKIREAADQARNNDTANLKKDIACMLTPDGSSVLTVLTKGKKASSKHDRGFENFTMGWYLCPISLDWNDADVRKAIREGKHAILASDWPRLLYANCDCNLDDLEQGLGRNMALVRVVKYLFTGRSAAFSESAGGKTTRSGNAALAGMTEITPRVVAYAACMLRYAISNEESWSAMDNEFNLQEFYWHVVTIFDDSDEFGKDLLAWWNLKVFGTSLESTIRPSTPSATAALSLLKIQRAAKRAANRLLRDVSNSQRNPISRRNSIDSEADDSGGVFDADLNHCQHSQTQSLQETSQAFTDPPFCHDMTQAQLTGDLGLPSNSTPTRAQDASSHDEENSVHAHASNPSSTARLAPSQTQRATSRSPSPQFFNTNNTVRSSSTSYARPIGSSRSGYQDSLGVRTRVEPPDHTRCSPRRAHSQWHLEQMLTTTRPFTGRAYPQAGSSAVPQLAQAPSHGAYAVHHPPPSWQYSDSTGETNSSSHRLDALAAVSLTKQ